MNWFATAIFGIILVSPYAQGGDAAKPTAPTAEAPKPSTEAPKPPPPADAAKPPADATKPPADAAKPAEAAKPAAAAAEKPPADAAKPGAPAAAEETPKLQISDAVKIESIISSCEDGVNKAMEGPRKKLPPEKEYPKILQTDRPQFHRLLEQEYAMEMAVALKYYQEKLAVFLKDDVCKAIKETSQWDKYFVCKLPLATYAKERECR